ncbi:MAG: ribosome-associated translation inhibitor RaiA [Cellvibrionales bacterium]|nr:ribosome-associated translation inhibitor RaiA [Cellvibrionales bacterium]
MQINISGHHLDISDPLREYVNKKMGKIFQHFDHITDTQVTLSVEKHRQKAEAQVRVTGGEVFAHEESHDMYASIDALADKIERQLVKNKEKLSAKR